MLHYVRTGSPARPVLLFLHGFMGSGADWAAVLPAFERDHDCLAVDLPGHGGSTGLPEAAYTLPGVTEALRETLDALAVARCSVVGYSMGGRIALHLALRFPERCRRLVLESASPGIETAAERQARREVDDARARHLETGDFQAFLEAWYRQPLFASLARHEGLLGRMVAARGRNDPRELARALRGFSTGRQLPLWERLGELKVSTWAVAGALDGTYVETARRTALRTPKGRAVVVPETGHNVHAERPAVFVDVLKDLLREP